MLSHVSFTDDWILSQEETHMNGSRILLVDDEIAFTNCLKKVFSYRGYQVEVATDGLSALPLIARNSFDAVILDVKMPGVDGVRVLLEIQRLAPKTQTILLTGHYSLHDEEEITKAGAFAYLLKPYPVSDLVALVGKAVADKVSGNK